MEASLSETPNCHITWHLESHCLENPSPHIGLLFLSFQGKVLQFHEKRKKRGLFESYVMEWNGDDGNKNNNKQPLILPDMQTS
jgi:hypothetical protein